MYECVSLAFVLVMQRDAFWNAYIPIWAARMEPETRKLEWTGCSDSQEKNVPNWDSNYDKLWQITKLLKNQPPPPEFSHFIAFLLTNVFRNLKKRWLFSNNCSKISDGSNFKNIDEMKYQGCGAIFSKKWYEIMKISWNLISFKWVCHSRVLDRWTASKIWLNCDKMS